jgi:uncharacterized protein
VRRIFTCWLIVLAFALRAAEVIPPPPAKYFNDYANVATSAAATRLNRTLEDFERETSNQIVVAVYNKMQSDSSIEDYTVRVAQSWRVGQKEKNNGAVLFVFAQDRKMFLQVGYGLEGALPDAICKRIIEDEIKPHFRNGNFDAGLSAGVAAILAATKGEYRGTGRTGAQPLVVTNSTPSRGLPPVAIVFIVILAIIILISARRRSRRGYYSRGGWTSGGWGGGSWGGGSSGGWSGGGGGGFSSGGGSFGGGGAGGSW